MKTDDFSCDPSKWSQDKLFRERRHGMPAVLEEYEARRMAQELDVSVAAARQSIANLKARGLISIPETVRSPTGGEATETAALTHKPTHVRTRLR